MPDGSVASYLKNPSVGKHGAQTIYVADLSRNLKWYSPDESPNYIRDSVTIAKPTKVLVLDTLFHRAFGPLTPDVQVLGSLANPGERDPRAFTADDVLPLGIKPKILGRGPSVLPTPHVPRYRELVEHVCARVGWTADDFDVYRCVVEYPLLNTVISMQSPLSEPGSKVSDVSYRLAHA